MRTPSMAILALALALSASACDARGRVSVQSTAPGPPGSVKPWPPPPPPPRLDVSVVGRDADGEARLRADIEILASTKFGGRGTGEEGARLTTEMISSRFRDLGLLPLGDATDDAGAPLAARSYLYRFSARANAKVDPPKLTFTSDSADPPKALPAGSIQAVDGSGSGEITGELVAAGFGVSTPEWDDYAGADVEGKIVVVRRGAPPIPKKTVDELYELSKFRRKIRAAKEHKAVGVIVVSSNDEIPPPPADPKGAGLPAIVMKRSAARAYFATANVDDAATWKPASPSAPVPIAHLRATVTTKVEVAGDWAHDVVGFVPAVANSAAGDEWVVLGAHHDHLGMGGPGSLAPGVRAIHPGADDNGSGTALLMEVARTFSRLPHRPARNVLFIAFGAEELGLVGSRAWCDDPTAPMEKIVGMVNTDMVGRLRERKLTIEGTAGEPAWPALFAPANDGLPLVIDIPKSDKYGGRSDHASFRDHDVPGAFLFTGEHPDYHRPTDTADKINYVGLEDIATFTARVVLGLSEKGFERAPPAEDAAPPKK